MVWHRLVMFFVFTGIFAAVFQLGSMTPVSEEDAALFMEEFEKLVLGIDAFGIFTHNLTLALPMFIPGFGVAWGLFSSWSTGFAVAAIAVSAPELTAIPPLAILFLSPFGLMELAAYSLGISRSCILVMALVRKEKIARFVVPTTIEVGIMIALLLAGGYIEYYMIEALQDNEKLLVPP